MSHSSPCSSTFSGPSQRRASKEPNMSLPAAFPGKHALQPLPIVGFELDSGALRLVSSGHHEESLASSVPLLVPDMYEHSYHLDFGAAAAKYFDAFWQNINWEVVTQRLENAQAARNALSTS